MLSHVDADTITCCSDAEALYSRSSADEERLYVQCYLCVSVFASVQAVSVAQSVVQSAAIR